MCILGFSSIGAEISNLKNKKAREHNKHPGSRPLISSRLARIASWLAGDYSWQVDFFLAGRSPFLAGWSLLVADRSPFLADWRLFLAG